MFTTCPLCEAMCGLEITLKDHRIDEIRGDKQDPLSRGHLCPKALALKTIQEDPNRLKQPLLKRDGQFEVVSWDEAYAIAAERITKIQRQHGNDSVALYLGNPNVHNVTALLNVREFSRTLKTKNRYSASSVDQWPHQHVAYEMYGHQFLVPIPDINRTQFLVIMGGNPLVSNGSMMSAPDVGNRIKDIRNRGGRVVVIDPRRSETAKKASDYIAIRPGTDVFMLAALVRQALENPTSGPWQSLCMGLDQLRSFVAPFSFERASQITGIDADVMAQLGRDFAAAETAVWYGRMGVSTQAFGATCQWLIQCLNILTNRLDRPGGAMFPKPAISVLDLLSKGHHGRWHSRVRKLPEFAGELPVACLAEEMEVEGPDQVKALVVAAGNPVVSTPHGSRLESAIKKLDFTLCIDFYLNETSRHADLVLPPVAPLERDHYDLIFHQLAIHNTAKYHDAPLIPAAKQPDDGQILMGLARAIAKAKKWPLKKRLGLAFHAWMGTKRMLNWALKRGPYRLSLKQLKKTPHGLDLGPMTPQLPDILRRPKIQLAPERFLADAKRLQETQPTTSMLLVGRRHLLQNNSWLRHVPHLTKQTDRSAMHMSPKDATRLGLVDGQRARVTSESGMVEVAIAISDAMAEGTVSIPHGYSNRAHPDSGGPFSDAVSVNELTSCKAIDPISGNAALNGVPVRIEALQAASD